MTDTISEQKDSAPLTCTRKLVHSWLHPSIQERPDPVRGGTGLMAVEHIEKGTLVAILGGHVMPVDGEPVFPDGSRDLACQIHDNFVLGTRFAEEIESVDAFNHSCDPNVGFHGQIFLYTMRNTEAGEWVCLDYAMALNVAWYRMACRCGAPNCRGTITGEDWKLPELQRRYDGYFQWYLQEKIRASRQGDTISVARWRAFTRMAQLGTGFLAWKATDYAFDYVAYPLAIWKLGLLYGGLLMSALSLLMCLLLLRFYDLMGRDWLGIEFVKNQRHYAGPSRWRRLLARLIARGDWLAFAVLSLRYDPFITTAYLRRGAYNGMSRRDWCIFMAGWFVSNAVWLAVCYGGVSFLRFLT